MLQVLTLEGVRRPTSGGGGHSASDDHFCFSWSLFAGAGDYTAWVEAQTTALTACLSELVVGALDSGDSSGGGGGGLVCLLARLE